MSKPSNRPSGATRRDFLTTAAAAGAAVATQLSLPAVHAAGNDVIKVGLIGCGGRGTGAAENVLNAAPNVKIVAVGDVFERQVKNCQNHLNEFAKNNRVKQLGNSVEIPDSNCHHGLDAYKGVLASEANYIILATPPGFRPNHLEAAVASGKTIFTEKPVAVDGPGIRKVFQAHEESQKKGLHIVAGTQRRHQKPYLETMKRIHDGAIGDLVGGQFYWMQNILWERISHLSNHPEIQGDAAVQIFNWYNYLWLCGDHIVEQHVHNLDVMNWAFGTHPSSAVGMGFRSRTDPRFGHIYDFFAIDFRFPNGVHTLSMCRQISNCANDVGENLVGTKGMCRVDSYTINGKRVAPRGGTDPYVQEHTDLIESVRSGKSLNELKTVAESTLTAIMGRMSAYTGQEVTWDKALHSQEDTYPTGLTLDMNLSAGSTPIPGKTRLA